MTADSEKLIFQKSQNPIFNFLNDINLLKKYSKGTGNPVQPWGYRILDHESNDVGVWYSAIRVAAVATTEDRQIVKLQPGRMVAMGDQLRQ